ncbi:MAG: sulfatase [Deltaproteobacteria bacterium]|nr:sulfatase [Deltaproteobacteria bacterium]
MWLLLLAACTRDVAPEAVPPARSSERLVMDLARPGSIPAWRALDRLSEASLDLPSEHPGPAPATWTLLGDWTPERSGQDGALWSRPLPEGVVLARSRSGAPPGWSLLAGDETVPWSPGIRREAAAFGWFAVGERLYVAGRADLPEVPVVLAREGLPEARRRLVPSASGLDPATFARLDVTIGPETRSCLLLPAPASASWRVRLPPEPAIGFGVALHPEGQPEGRPGPATVALEVDGRTAWTSDVDPSDGFLDVTVDLAEFADREVDLRFTARAGQDGVVALVAAPTVASRVTEDPRRVVLVGIDTFRWDAPATSGGAPDVAPELDALAAGSFVFDRAFAPAPRTKPSFRTAFTGRWPLGAVGAQSMARLVHTAGLSTAGFSANMHLVARFGFQDGYDLWFYENGARAEEQVDRALAWLDAHRHEDALVFVHIMDPHIYYNAPGRFEKLFVREEPPDFPERFNRWDIVRMQNRGRMREVEKAYVRALYDGEIRYTSAQIGRLAQGLDALPGRTLLLLHSDHGEEFWDHGGFEHNHSLYDELTRVILWIRPPGGWAGGPHRISVPASLADIAPTIWDLLGIPRATWPPVDGTSLAPLLDPASAASASELEALLSDRPLPMGFLMYDAERWGVAWHEGRYLLRTGDGHEELYDLSTDPTQSRNLAEGRAEELPAWRDRLARVTGWPVGLGWRIDYRGRTAGAFDLSCPEPITAAGVLDPESTRKRRANVEWGEQPRVRPEEVAAVFRATDGASVHVEPGPHPSGTILLFFDGDPPPACTLTQDGRSTDFGPGLPAAGLTAQVGPCILPLESEATVFAAERADDDTLDALRAMGYVE